MKVWEGHRAPAPPAEAWEGGVGLLSTVASADFVFVTGTGLSQYVLLSKSFVDVVSA